MASSYTAADLSGLKCLSLLAILYGLMSALIYHIVHMKHIEPLGLDAPPYRFSEGRALEHLRILSKEIDGRQEGRPGLLQAAHYIKSQLEMLKERAGPNIRVEVEENIVEGSFNMVFLGHSISLAYRNHTNVIMRISSADARDDDPSVLVNGHFDSPLGSPGAGDCGSCVVSMLELGRLIVDSGWVPPQPIIFLFNGAEELFMLGAHGFMKTQRWRDTIGAFINVEASGTGGPDLVCQSGPGSWPSAVYSQSAKHPMANSAAQDVFPVIPGDTDYRIFAEDSADIPGLDIIFILGGYFYHTASDTMERLLPGSIQARGHNLFSLIEAFSSSPELRNAQDRKSLVNSGTERGVFFDYLSTFMVFYSKKQALILHSIPMVIFILMPLLKCLLTPGSHSLFGTLSNYVKGMLFHFIGIILAILVPIVFAIIRLLFVRHAMSWFARPYLAFLMFVPSSLVGLLIPRFVSARRTSTEALSYEARFWGAFGLYAFMTLAYLSAGLGGGFLTFFFAAAMLPAWISFCVFMKIFGTQSLRSAMGYVIPLIPCLLYSIYFDGLLVQFLIEKMGMMGSLPPPYGYFIPDIVVAAIVGITVGWSVGPLIPILGHWLARKAVVQFLLHLSVLALALSSQFFPYSTAAPKRVVFQHRVLTADAGQLLNSSYEFSVVDSNSLLFLFKNAPEAAKALNISPDLSYETTDQSLRENWLAIFPVSFLFSRSLKFPARSDEILKQYNTFPHISTYKPQTVSSNGSRRIYLDFQLGSLKEVWVAVLNITGPLSGWSFADGTLPAPEAVDGGPPSYILRLSGSSHLAWVFWLEASNSEPLRVEVAALEQQLTEEAKKLKGLFPSWVDIIAYSSFMSSYTF
ncbi:Peptidase M28 [Dillenia turbinata]|uniref:Peptidase M28 n=1 Tax=Dillenia turbinata TaxID=194707 RepID=A0AAN8UV13_9MAGN